MANIPEASHLEIGTLAQWVGATATFLAVLVALFKEDLVRLWRRPRLSLSISLRPPHCHKTVVSYTVQKIPQTRGGSAECYYLRLWVENVGRTRAERVQVFVANLARRSADGTFRDHDGFLPMNLLWSHGQGSSGEREIYAEGISPGMGKHCDLGHIIDPKYKSDVGEDLAGLSAEEPVLGLELEMRPGNLGHLVRPGTYRLELRLAAANCYPTTTVVELSFTGRWFSNETQMFSEGIGARVI